MFFGGEINFWIEVDFGLEMIEEKCWKFELLFYKGNEIVDERNVGWLF